MQPDDIGFQILRDNAAPLCADIACGTQILLRETGLLHNAVLCNISDQIQNILRVDTGVNITDAIIENFVSVTRSVFLACSSMAFRTAL